MMVNIMANIKGGRCGLAVPVNTATNSALIVPIWVPEELLSEARGEVSPRLMAHLRTRLQEELQDPQGVVHQQVRLQPTWSDLQGSPKCRKL